MKICYLELIKLTLVLLLATIINITTPYLLHTLVLVCIIFILRQAFLLHQLEHWLIHGGKIETKVYQGNWRLLYTHILKLIKSDKKRQKKLSNIISKFNKATATLPDAVVIMSHDNNLTWFNNTAKLTLGLKKEHRGQNISRIFNDQEEFKDFLYKKDPNNILTLKSPLKNGIILDLKIVNYEQDSYLLLAHDVTYLKNIERMRTDFVDNISHELRTPLTVLKGYIETLEDMELDKSPLLTHSLTQMDVQSQRMQYLVDDLLLLANLETQKIDSDCVNIAALLAQIYQENEALIEHKNRVHIVIESEVNILGNEQELRSAFTNLINNALKYSPKDTLTTVKWYEDNKTMVLEVIDQGEGIPKDDIPKITERFYRVDSKRQQETRGTGLGLAIVKHVLSRHYAELIIESELGKGSSFRCVFPQKISC